MQPEVQHVIASVMHDALILSVAASLLNLPEMHTDKLSGGSLCTFSIKQNNKYVTVQDYITNNNAEFNSSLITR
jgi:hypothetical protein